MTSAVAGLEEALALVRGTKKSLLSEGMSELSFTLGVLNVAFTAFLLAAYPQHFWCWQAPKCGLLLFVTLKQRLKQNTAFYMLDFCWQANAILAVYSVLACFKLHDTHWPLDPGDTFLAFFALANGPLGWSVIAQSNAMVLHSAQHSAALFIHLAPPILSWSFRWFGDLIARDWPARFGPALDQVSGAHSVDLWRMWSLGAAAYMAWWVPYTIWLFVHGRYQSPATTGMDTVWASTVRTNASLRSLLGIKSADAANPNQPLAAVKYMLLHALLCLLLLLGSHVMWFSFELHTAFCVFLFVASVRNGAIRYVKMTTRFYEKSLETALAKAKGGDSTKNGGSNSESASSRSKTPNRKKK